MIMIRKTCFSWNKQTSNQKEQGARKLKTNLTQGSCEPPTAHHCMGSKLTSFSGEKQIQHD